jgi:hypothetical protein
VKIKRRGNYVVGMRWGVSRQQKREKKKKKRSKAASEEKKERKKRRHGVSVLSEWCTYDKKKDT